MAPRKQAINDATSKGNAIGTIGGTTLSPFNNQLHTTENTGSSLPQRATTIV